MPGVLAENRRDGEKGQSQIAWYIAGCWNDLQVSCVYAHELMSDSPEKDIGLCVEVRAT